MKKSLISTTHKYAKRLMLSVAFAIGLNSCGSGNSSSSQFTVAPQSMDQVTLNLFSSAMSLFFEVTGVAGGVESGVVQYTQGGAGFFTSDVDFAGGQAETKIYTPTSLSGLRYTYTPGSGNTGQLVLTYTNAVFDDLAVFRTQTTGNITVFQIGEPHRIFSNTRRTITFDILFVDNGSVISGATIRTEEIQLNDNDSSLSDAAVNSGTTVAGTIDTDKSTLRLSGSALPIGYNPTFDPDAILSGVPVSIDNGTLVFAGVTPNLRMAFNTSSLGSSPPSLPSADFPDESGNVLISEDGTSTATGSGPYSYARIRASIAELAVRVTTTGGTGGTTIPAGEVVYTLDFNTLTYTASDGTSGTFNDNGARF